MKVSLSWLKDYVDIDMDVAKLADMLTMAGLEVEAVEDRYSYLERVVVGSITGVEPHPKADKLTLCHVEAGGSRYRVVCGAPNAKVGLKAPLALPGSEFPNGLQITESVIRGERSQGMLCSEAELGLGTDRSGLMVLDPQLIEGTPLNRALELQDAVLEIGLTPNRSDCLSMFGIAREIAGFSGTRLRRPEIQLPETSGEIIQYTSVEIQSPDHCPRYAARLLDHITVGPSPFWLQDRLMSVGLRPINNLVDITNYVMLETGQPLHAFDFDNLAQNRIVVRTASEGEAFTTLDGKERRLSRDMLMICDGEKPVGIGGVMGGLNSEIQEQTQRVLIESAYFNPVSIRKTAKKLGLSTDASHRFERGVDPNGTLYALDRAAGLMAELGGGRLFGGTIDMVSDLPVPPTIDLSVAATNRLLGTDLTADEMTVLLEAITFEVSPAENSGTDRILRVKVPSYRVDVSRPEDLMEEIARCNGYDRIPVTFPAMPPATRPAPEMFEQRRRLRMLLKGIGFTETINYSFIHKESSSRLRLAPDDERRNQLGLLNPLTEDQAVLRTSLIPGLLETMQRNLARQSRTLKLFEIGKIFISQGADTLPRETEMLAGLWTGDRQENSWHTKAVPCDFYDIKGAVEVLLVELKILQVNYTQMPDKRCSYTRPGATARIMVNGQEIGLVGAVHPRVLNAYDLKQEAFVFEINLQQLQGLTPGTLQAQPLPKYPSVARDATLIVDRSIEVHTIVLQVYDMREPLVEQVQLIDIFEGRPIPVERKSITLRVTYRSTETTLDDEMVNRVHKHIINRLVARFKADLPA